MLAVKVIYNEKVIRAKVLRVKNGDSADSVLVNLLNISKEISKCYVGPKSSDFELSRIIEIGSTDEIYHIK